MPFQPGARIGRIRIDALLGAGGMGEVWRGFDEKLERPVALKVVHADKRFHPAMRARFLREARVLSKLDHPQICRIYDVLERDDGDYLVLELVEGNTLRDPMQKGMARGKAIDIALQVAGVLEAAHARGVIHRDLKPDNIMLTPSGGVKVLDFGLARTIGDEPAGALPPEDFTFDDEEKTAVLGRSMTTTAPDASRTVAGSLVGTVHYMSPEQARGLPLSEASDVYALGIVLYEMLAGGSAYGPTDTTSDLLLRVRRAEVVPHDFRDRELQTLIGRMLALYPADRPTPGDVVKALTSVRDRPARRRRKLIAAATTAALVLVLTGAFFVSRSVDAQRRLFGKASSGRVAILPFQNATGDQSLQWMELGLADLVADGLGRARGVNVVPPNDVARAMKNHGIRGGTLSEAQRRKLVEDLGADVLIAPTVVANDGKFTIRYAALTSERAEGPREATSSVLVEAAKQMSVDLAERIDPAASTRAVRERYSLDNLANMLYAMARQEKQMRGARVAANYLTVCLDRDPEFLIAKMELAGCYKDMGENDRAAQLLAEITQRAAAKQDHEMVARTRLARASWAVDEGNYPEAEKSAAAALGMAQRLNERELAGRAQTVLGETAWRRGQLDRAGQLFEQALVTFIALRNQHEQAETYNNLGVLADSDQRTEESRQMFAKAMAIADRLNDRFLAATVIGNYAMAEGNANNFKKAEELTRRQLALTREVADFSTEIFALANLGLWEYAQGKEEAAIATVQQAHAAAVKIGHPRIEAILLSNLATAYTKRGNLVEARRYNDLAQARNSGLDDPEVDRDVQLGLAYLRIREGKLDEAERALTRAERWRPNPRTRMMRGRLAYARGDYAKAFAHVSEARRENNAWLIQNEQMYRAFEESARTGRAAKAVFEGGV